MSRIRKELRIWGEFCVWRKALWPNCNENRGGEVAVQRNSNCACWDRHKTQLVIVKPNERVVNCSEV